jgi:hypothetical protein
VSPKRPNRYTNPWRVCTFVQCIGHGEGRLHLPHPGQCPLVLCPGTGTPHSGHRKRQGRGFIKGDSHHRTWPECDPAQRGNRRPGSPRQGQGFPVTVAQHPQNLGRTTLPATVLLTVLLRVFATGVCSRTVGSTLRGVLAPGAREHNGGLRKGGKVLCSLHIRAQAYVSFLGGESGAAGGSPLPLRAGLPPE